MTRRTKAERRVRDGAVSDYYGRRSTRKSLFIMPNERTKFDQVALAEARKVDYDG